MNRHANSVDKEFSRFRKQQGRHMKSFWVFFSASAFVGLSAIVFTGWVIVKLMAHFGVL